jgi:hypothetical protein
VVNAKGCDLSHGDLEGSMARTQIMVGMPSLHSFCLDSAVLGGWWEILLVLGVKFWRWD